MTQPTAFTLTPAQKNEITRLGDAGNYSAMYKYIANQIEINNQNSEIGIYVPGGIESKEYYWFKEAAKENNRVREQQGQVLSFAFLN
jgi:hypothetical protein